MMKLRHLFAALFALFELPVLLPFAAGAFIAGLARGVSALASWWGRLCVRLFRQSPSARQERLASPALGH